MATIDRLTKNVPHKKTVVRCQFVKEQDKPINKLGIHSLNRLNDDGI